MIFHQRDSNASDRLRYLREIINQQLSIFPLKNYSYVFLGVLVYVLRSISPNSFYDVNLPMSNSFQMLFYISCLSFPIIFAFTKIFSPQNFCLKNLFDPFLFFFCNRPSLLIYGRTMAASKKKFFPPPTAGMTRIYIREGLGFRDWGVGQKGKTDRNWGQSWESYDSQIQKLLPGTKGSCPLYKSLPIPNGIKSW